MTLGLDGNLKTFGLARFFSSSFFFLIFFFFLFFSSFFVSSLFSFSVLCLYVCTNYAIQLGFSVIIFLLVRFDLNIFCFVPLTCVYITYVLIMPYCRNFPFVFFFLSSSFCILILLKKNIKNKKWLSMYALIMPYCRSFRLYFSSF